MKIIFSIFALALSLGVTFTAQAADRKLGNLIVVERTIPNVYQSCVDQAASEKDTSDLYSCKFDTTQGQKTDFSPGFHRLLNLYTETCAVEASLQNSKILVLFRSQTPNSGFTSAKSCLRQALEASPNKDSFKYIVYTVE